MASITLTVVGTTIGTVTATNTMSQPDGDRFMAYLGAAYGSYVNDDGETIQRTPQEVVEAAWAAIRSGMMANVVNYEKQKAAEAAAAAITDIVVA